MSGTDAAVLADDELLRTVLPAIRADYKAAETYRHHPGPPLACPLLVVNGDRDPEVTAEEAEAWTDHTSAGCTFHWFLGGHFYLNDHAPEVIALIRDEVLNRL